MTHSIHKQDASKIIVQVITANRFLQTGIYACLKMQSTAYEFISADELLADDVRQQAQKLVLIDIDNLSFEREYWPDAAESAKDADFLAVMSYSSLELYEIPHIKLTDSLDEIATAMINVIELRKKLPARKERVYAPFTLKEQDILLCLMNDYGIGKMHQLLRISKKQIYALRTRIRKKTAALNQKDMFTVLSLYRFIDLYVSSERNEYIPRLSGDYYRRRTFSARVLRNAELKNVIT